MTHQTNRATANWLSANPLSVTQTSHDLHPGNRGQTETQSGYPRSPPHRPSGTLLRWETQFRRGTARDQCSAVTVRRATTEAFGRSLPRRPLQEKAGPLPHVTATKLPGSARTLPPPSSPTARPLLCRPLSSIPDHRRRRSRDEKSLVTVIREMVQEEVGNAIQSLLGGVSTGGRSANGRHRRRRRGTWRPGGPGRPPKAVAEKMAQKKAAATKPKTVRRRRRRRAVLAVHRDRRRRRLDREGRGSLDAVGDHPRRPSNQPDPRAASRTNMRCGNVTLSTAMGGGKMNALACDAFNALRVHAPWRAPTLPAPRLVRPCDLRYPVSPPESRVDRVAPEHLLRSGLKAARRVTSWSVGRTSSAARIAADADDYPPTRAGTGSSYGACGLNLGR